MYVCMYVCIYLTVYPYAPTYQHRARGEGHNIDTVGESNDEAIHPLGGSIDDDTSAVFNFLANGLDQYRLLHFEMLFLGVDTNLQRP
jgi:hypothetical protein